jgi:hypothetical protein
MVMVDRTLLLIDCDELISVYREFPNTPWKVFSWGYPPIFVNPGTNTVTFAEVLW